MGRTTWWRVAVLGVSVLLLVCSLGCSKKATPSIAKQEPSKAAPSARPAPAPLVSEAEARALLERWQSSQNARDFTHYSNLYAEKFRGVKRVAAQSTRFDREGWLEDRQGMFKRPMRVELSDVKFSVTCCTATVRFTQTWSSGTFQDRGTKELLIVPTKDGPRIAIEEMLESQVAREGQVADFDAGDLRFVVHLDGPYLVLAHEADDDIAKGPPEVVGKGFSTRRPVIESKLPKEVLAAQALSYGLYAETGLACQARLGEVFLLRRVVPHFGTVMRWSGQVDYEPKIEALSPAELGQAAWDEAQGGTMLVAKVIDPESKCAKALWARADDRPQPQVFNLEPITSELKDRLEKKVHARSDYKSLSRVYQEYVADGKTTPAKSWEFDQGSEPEYQSWRSKDRQLVSYQASVGSGCGDFTVGFWVIYEVQGNELRLLTDGQEQEVPRQFWIDAIVDLNGDGLIEALGGDWQGVAGEASALMRGTPAGMRLVRDVYPPFLDCGC